jgi:hypothetical protein
MATVKKKTQILNTNQFFSDHFCRLGEQPKDLQTIFEVGLHVTRRGTESVIIFMLSGPRGTNCFLQAAG